MTDTADAMAAWRKDGTPGPWAMAHLYPQVDWELSKIAPDMADLIDAQAAQIAMWKQNSRDTFDAMCAMRDTINDRVPMPSLESDLLQGPEDSIFCVTVADAVVSYIDAQAKQIAALVAPVNFAEIDAAFASTPFDEKQSPEWLQRPAYIANLVRHIMTARAALAAHRS